MISKLLRFVDPLCDPTSDTNVVCSFHTQFITTGNQYQVLRQRAYMNIYRCAQTELLCMGPFTDTPLLHTDTYRYTLQYLMSLSTHYTGPWTLIWSQLHPGEQLLTTISAVECSHSPHRIIHQPRKTLGRENMLPPKICMTDSSKA